MIWHIHASDFDSFLRKEGFRPISQIADQTLYERDKQSLFVRRSTTLTQAEVDAICDANDLSPPPFDSFFGDERRRRSDGRRAALDGGADVNFGRRRGLASILEPSGLIVARVLPGTISVQRHAPS